MKGVWMLGSVSVVAGMAAALVAAAPKPVRQIVVRGEPNGVYGSRLVSGAVQERPTGAVRAQVAAPAEDARTPESLNSPGGSLVQVDAFVAGEGEGKHRTGAGVLATKSGHIFTPLFVVDGAEMVIVSFRNQARVPARVLGKDAQSKLAVLKVAAVPEGIACPALCGDAAEKSGAAVVLLNLDGKELKSVSGRVVRSGRNVGPLRDVLEVQLEGAPSQVGGVVLDAAGAVVGVPLAVMNDGPTGATKLLVLPASQIRLAVDRMLKEGPAAEPRREIPASVA